MRRSRKKAGIEYPKDQDQAMKTKLAVQVNAVETMHPYIQMKTSKKPAIARGSVLALFMLVAAGHPARADENTLPLAGAWKFRLDAKDVGVAEKWFAQKFDDTIQHLQDSLIPAYWIDQTHLHARGGNTAMNEEKLAANKLAEIMEARGCPIAPAVLQGFIDRIVKCDRLLAIISIQEAASAGLNPKKVAQDYALVAKGDREAAAGHYANAIEHYRNAWRHALQLQLQADLNVDGSTRLRFVGNNSASYLIEVSTDMVNWVSLGTCTADAQGDVEFTDPAVVSRSARFYRAVEQ